MSEFVETKLSDLYIHNALIAGIAVFAKSINHIDLPAGMSEDALDPLRLLLIELRDSCLDFIDEKEHELVAHVKESTFMGLKEEWDA